jgi:hypothetical protein
MPRQDEWKQGRNEGKKEGGREGKREGKKEECGEVFGKEGRGFRKKYDDMKRKTREGSRSW